MVIIMIVVIVAIIVMIVVGIVMVAGEPWRDSTIFCATATKGQNLSVVRSETCAVDCVLHPGFL